MDRALLQLLGQHRGDARLLRGRRGARRAAHRRQHRRPAGRAGARGRRAGGRPAGDLPAAGRRRLHVRRRRRGRRRWPAPRRAIHTEIDAAAAFLERAGATRCRRRRAEIAAQLERHAPPVDLRQRPDGAGRPPLEDARSTRTRSCPPSTPSCPRPTTTRSAAGPAPAPSRMAAVFLEDCDQHPRERRRFELTAEAGRRATRRDRGAGGDRGRDPGRAPALGDDARRPRLARAGRAGAGSTRSAIEAIDQLKEGDGGDEGDGAGGGAGDAAAADHLRDAEADGAGAEQAGDGAHPAPARPPRLHRDDRQPALVPGADRGLLRRRLGAAASRSPTAARSSCSAPPAASATPPSSSATPSSSSPATRSPTSTWRRCASSTSPTTGSRRWR